MNLYQEIILLKTWFKGKFCVENVISYYEPLIKPIESANHYFWTNFPIRKYPNEKRGIRREDESRRETIDFDLSGYDLKPRQVRLLLNNCTEHKIGLHILEAARGIIKNDNVYQEQLAL